MKTKLAALLLCCAGMVALSACDDLLDTEPWHAVSPEVALSDWTGLEGLVRSTYIRNRAWNLYGNLLVLGPEMLADNGMMRPGASRHQALSQNTLRSHMTGVWNTAYLQINEINTALAGLDAFEPVPGVTRAEIDQRTGEMYFNRALAYHNLVKVFGYEPGREVGGWTQGVIIRTEPTRTIEDADFRARASVAEVYSLIKSDLSQAISLLSAGSRMAYYGNHAAALALRARVALYESDWAAAADFATQAMAASPVGLVDQEAYVSVDYAEGDDHLRSNITSISSIFDGRPNPESLFEVAILAARESLGVNDALSPYLSPRQWQANIPPDDLLELFEEGDVRRLLYPFDDVSHGAPYTVKFFESNDLWTDNVPVIRYPELLLIRAEARAAQGDVPGAVQDLNTLRTARGASEVSAANTGEAINLVLRERRLEFAFEGHRFFDLKRRSMDITKPGGAVGVTYTDIRILADLPSAQVALNPLLEQNPGY